MNKPDLPQKQGGETGTLEKNMRIIDNKAAAKNKAVF